MEMADSMELVELLASATEGLAKSLESLETRLSPSLGVEAMGKKGRGTVATERIPRGTIIAVEKPLASAVSHSDGFCDHCALPASAVATCADCDAAYCSRACADAAAGEYHWLECGQPTTLIGEPGGLFRLTIRVFLATPPALRHIWDHSRRVELSANLGAVLDSPVNYLTLAASLPNHKPETRAMPNYDNLLSRLRIIARKLKARDGTRSSVTLNQLVHVLMVAYTNTFNMYRNGEPSEWGSPESSVIGSGFYPAVSLLNHSCLANTTRSFHGTTMVMRVIRDIEVGDEITTTYGVDVKNQLTADRRETLNNWVFTCECSEACGNKAWRRKEAAFWGFACRHCAHGPAVPVGKTPWNLEEIYEWCRTHPLVPGSMRGSLPVRCFDCGKDDRVPGDTIEHVIVAMQTIRKERPCPSNVAELVVGLHALNQTRLRVEWTGEFLRCRQLGSFDAAALRAMEAVQSNLISFLGGPFDSDVADDAVEGIRVLLCLPVLSVEAKARAVRLKALAVAVLATHYGHQSPEANRARAIPI